MNARTWDTTYPGGAWYEWATGTHWSKETGGFQYRNANEYDTSSEGYTPFGDE